MGRNDGNALLVAPGLLDRLGVRPEQRASILGQIISASPLPVYVLDPAGVFLYVSAVGAEVLGHAPEAVLGKTWRDLGLPAEAVEPLARACRAVLAGGRPEGGEVRLPTVLGQRYFEYLLMPLYGAERALVAVMLALRDITERKQAEALRTHARQQAAVTELGQRALLDSDPVRLMQGAAELVAETLEVEYAEVLERLPGGQTLLLRAGVGWEEGSLGRMTLAAGPETQAGYTLRSRRPVVVEDVRRETRFAVDPTLRDRGIVSGLCVAIAGLEQPWGVLGAHCLRPRTFSEDDIHFMEAMANILALARERQAADEALREKTSQLQAIFAAWPDLYFRLDAQGRVLDYKAGQPADLYVPPEQFLGRRMADVLPPTVGRQVREAVARVARSGAAATLEYSLPVPAGEQDFEARLLPLPGGQIMAIVRNITRRKRAERVQQLLANAGQLLASSLDYQATLQSIVRLIVPALADWAVIEMLEDHRIRQAGVAHVDSAKEELAREVGRRYPLDPHSPPVADVIRRGEPQVWPEVPESLLREVARNPEHLAMLRELGVNSVIVAPLVARERLLGGLLLVRRDPTRPYGAQDLALAQELGRRAGLSVDNARLYQEAQAAIRARDEFLSAAAHELKTPLTSLRGFAQLVVRQMAKGQPPDPERLRRVLEVIDRQSERLSSLVSQMLDIALVESGRLELHRQQVDVAALVRDLLEHMPQVRARHPVALEAPAPIPALVDPQRVAQVVRNLVDNAAKFSPEGAPIEVKVAAPDAETVRIAVRDHGYGIPPEQRQWLFQRFYQAEPGRAIGGLGLGLYLGRQLVEAHGGRIEAEFPPDGGSRFVVTLPRG